MFIAVILAVAAVLWLATRTGGTGHTAVLRYGDPQVEQRIDLRRNADYDVGYRAGTPSICTWKTAALPLWTAHAPTTPVSASAC